MIHDILDLHTHTIMSGHAYSTMQEMIRSASEKDVKLLGITEHATSTVWTTPLPASMNHAMTAEPWRRTQRLTSVP